MATGWLLRPAVTRDVTTAPPPPRRAPRVLRKAEVAPSAISYHVIGIALATAAFVVTIPLIPLTALLAWLYYRRYFATLEVVLTTRELQVARGVLNRQEKSIPLEKITDLAVVQGPVMRRMGIKGLQVETAGQSGATGSALVRLVGLVDTDGFRDAALDQRDKVTDRQDAPALAGQLPADDLLVQIHQTLLRIEAALVADRGDGIGRDPDG
jgi:putative membrane protein